MSLTPMKISESFRRFGVGESSKHIVAIKVGGDATEIEKHLLQNVQGTHMALSDAKLVELQDPARIKKAFKLEVGPGAEAYVLGSMALKGS
jgi:EKC/KEOPS complex subunit CGI121/TPRKB